MSYIGTYVGVIGETDHVVSRVKLLQTFVRTMAHNVVRRQCGHSDRHMCGVRSELEIEGTMEHTLVDCYYQTLKDLAAQSC